METARFLGGCPWASLRHFPVHWPCSPGGPLASCCPLQLIKAIAMHGSMCMHAHWSQNKFTWLNVAEGRQKFPSRTLKWDWQMIVRLASAVCSASTPTAVKACAICRQLPSSMSLPHVFLQLYLWPFISEASVVDNHVQPLFSHDGLGGLAQHLLGSSFEIMEGTRLTSACCCTSRSGRFLASCINEVYSAQSKMGRFAQQMQGRHHLPTTHHWKMMRARACMCEGGEGGGCR